MGKLKKEFEEYKKYFHNLEEEVIILKYPMGRIIKRQANGWSSFEDIWYYQYGHSECYIPNMSDIMKPVSFRRIGRHVEFKFNDGYYATYAFNGTLNPISNYITIDFGDIEFIEV
jgi:hypothetical protein